MTSADQLTVARAASVPVVVLLFSWNFDNHAYWATVVFCLAMATDFFDGRLARRIGRNELAVIGLCETYVIAQKQYAAEARDGNPAGA